MIGMVNKLADLIFKAINGIVGFVLELIPSLFKLVFLLSPFLLVVLTTYIYFGARITIIVSCVLFALFVFGLAISSRYEDEAKRLTLPIVLGVLVVNIFLLGLSLYYGEDNSRVQALLTVVSDGGKSQNLSLTDQKAVRRNFSPQELKAYLVAIEQQASAEYRKMDLDIFINAIDNISELGGLHKIPTEQLTKVVSAAVSLENRNRKNYRDPHVQVLNAALFALTSAEPQHKNSCEIIFSLQALATRMQSTLKNAADKMCF